MGRNSQAVPSKLFEMVLDGREVIEACQRGDQDAFRQLFESNKDRVYSIALRYSGNEAVAMDIAQDTFLKLLAKIQDFRGQASFDSWLYRMVANSCLDHRRRARRWMPLLEDLVNLFTVRRETVLHDLLRNEMQHDVQQVVAGLAPEQRIVVVLRYTENLSYDEISEILGCSPGTVGSRLNRAHKVLERRLSYLRVSRRQQ
ncbi:MAG TPA: sigma-70 family RNA polymerase sigma factor [Bryobacteraceae bacterium]|nr:sigma-70 family RNA polymerase sigma factor [Bryobacteraceae bacterium]